MDLKRSSKQLLVGQVDIAYSLTVRIDRPQPPLAPSNFTFNLLF